MHVGAATALVVLGNPDTVETYAAAWRNGARFASALSEPTSGNQFFVPLQEAFPPKGDGSSRAPSGSFRDARQQITSWSTP
jgi:hypothetical protein